MDGGRCDQDIGLGTWTFGELEFLLVSFPDLLPPTASPNFILMFCYDKRGRGLPFWKLKIQ
jgi:hypothetical protein